MTVRVGENIIAGGGSLEKDNITITQNEDSQIQTVGKVNQNTTESATPVLYDWVGTLQEYQDQQIELLHPTWICYITDDDGPGVDNGVSILDFKWEDKILDDMRWLRSDTFSWQDGKIYKSAYQHLFMDLYLENINLYCWASANTSKVIYTQTETPVINDMTYDSNGHPWKIINSVNNNEIDVLNAPVAEAGPYIRNVAGDLLDVTANLGTQTTETIAGTSITYYIAPDGHKICFPDQAPAVETIFENTGVAWFYILDTTNTKFKLPRTKFEFTGLRDTVGNYVANNGASGSDIHATQMYLYFYVGEFSRGAIENTAGITSEALNAKMDAANFQIVTALPANPDPNVFYFLVS